MPMLFADVPSMLRAHGIDSPESALATNGYSGARFSSVTSRGERFVLKRLRVGDDWLMRVTQDTAYREAQFAVAPLLDCMPDGIELPAVAAAFDGDGRAILMRDVSDALFFPERGAPAGDAIDQVLRRIAEMHAAFWDVRLDDAGVDWCGVEDRVTMLSPRTGQMMIDEGNDFGFARGWQRFEELAPPELARFVRAAFLDVRPLAKVMRGLPATLIHGDLKASNCGVEGTRLVLIDWSMVMTAPVALEMAWFLAVNSSVLAWPLDETIERYRSRLERALGAVRFEGARWREQRALISVLGVLLYGWGKALDAEAGRPDELRWWCDGALDGMRVLGL